MSGFDEMPGFGPPPPFNNAHPSSAPGFGPPPPFVQQGSFGGNYHANNNNNPQRPNAQYSASPAVHVGVGAGSLYGSAPLVGRAGNAHQYNIKTYELPEQSQMPPPSYGAPATLPTFQPPIAPLRIQPLPASEGHREATNTVWLGFQDTYVSEEDLRNLFNQFGKVLRLQRNQAKNCVFVHYQDVREARSAVESPSTRQFLGPSVRISYGRMFSYDAEELERYDQPWSKRGGIHVNIDPGAMNMYPGGIDQQQQQFPPPHSSSARPPSEPSSIVWVGDITPDVTDELLRLNFASFGNILTINRNDMKGMAFVHLDSVEAATRAIRNLRSVPIAGKFLKMNYGRPQRDDMQRRDDREDRDPPTNVVWLGMLAPSVTRADIDVLLQGYEGYIDAEHFPERAFAFAHFETVEQAVRCRQALRGQQLHNVTLRVGFGKSNHNRMPVDRSAAPGPAFNQYDTPAGNSGALIATADRGQMQVTSLPAEGSPVPAATTSAVVPKYVTRSRPTPQVTVETRVNALAASSYFKCNVPPPHLLPSVVHEICEAVDNVTSTSSAEQLTKVLKKHGADATLPHLCAVVAKRLKDYHDADPHRKMHVVYSVALMLHEHPKPRPALDAFCLLLSVAFNGQCKDGAQNLARLMKSFRRYLEPELQEADALIVAQFESIEKKYRVDSELGELLKKIKR